MAGVKVFVGLHRRTDRTEQAFHDHWRHPHGTLGLGVAGARHYVQSHRIDTPLLEPSPTRFDGVVEVWFDCVDDAFNRPNDPVYKTHLGPDEPNFVDMDKTRFLIAQEEVLLAGLGPRHDADEASCHWSEHKRPLAIKLIQFYHRDDKDWMTSEDLALGRAIGALRHVRSRPHPAAAARMEPMFAGVRELWWPTLSAFEAGVADGKDAWHALVGRSGAAINLVAQAERYL